MIDRFFYSDLGNAYHVRAELQCAISRVSAFVHAGIRGVLCTLEKVRSIVCHLL